MKYPTFLGIDLTSAEAKPSACVGLDNRSQLIYFGFRAKDCDIIALVNFYRPEVIAIDAPLRLPLGLCCLEENSPCKPESSWKTRQCDQELRWQGIPCYPTGKKTFIKDFIYRGIELKASIRREVKQSSQVIEVYPFASKVRLFGKVVPRKSTRKGMTFHRDKLIDILPALGCHINAVDHGLCDAAITAYTTLLYRQNKAEALGSAEEGLIVLPI